MRLQRNNNAGIYGFTFWVRGKPWDIVVDDQLYVSGANKNLVYARADAQQAMMWGPVIEKAWAKVTGSYANYFGSWGTQVTWVEEGIRAMTGFPVITEDVGTVQQKYTDLWGNLTLGDQNNYVMTATAELYADSVCGLRRQAPYVIVKPFTTTYSGSTEQLVLLRDPAGASGYNGNWRSADTTRWTAQTIQSVPYGVDPTNQAFIDKGYFVVPLDQFAYNANQN